MGLFNRCFQRTYIEIYIITKKVSFLWSRAKLSWLFFRCKLALSQKALDNYGVEYDRELDIYRQKIQDMTNFGRNVFGEDKFDNILDEHDSDKD